CCIFFMVLIKQLLAWLQAQNLFAACFFQPVCKRRDHVTFASACCQLKNSRLNRTPHPVGGGVYGVLLVGSLCVGPGFSPCSNRADLALVAAVMMLFVYIS